MRNDELLSLFTPQTRRDKQIRVGASNLSNPCALCLAEDILPGIKDKSGIELVPREMRGVQLRHGGEDRNGHPPRSGVLGEAAFPEVGAWSSASSSGSTRTTG